MATTPWIILDRDGVINVDRVDYVKNMDEWIAIDGSIDAIAQLSLAGYKIAVATNQSGIGREVYTFEDMDVLHQHLDAEVIARGGKIEGVFFCPHTPEDECACRKPKPGLLDNIEEAHETDLRGVPFVGDALRDLEAAHEKGCMPVLVRTGKGRETEKLIQNDPRFQSIAVYDDLANYVQVLLHNH